MKTKVGVMGSAGGVADEAERLIELLPKKNARAVVIFDEDPERLLERCLEALKDSRDEGG